MKHIEDGAASKKFICSDDKADIFLIGDSIRLGYCDIVKTNLHNDANVFYVEDNCRNTQYVITSLHGWFNKFSAPEKVDLVLFNCGHWDIAHWLGVECSLTDIDEYARNIRIIIDLLRKLFINAKIVFATSTPMNPNGVVGVNPRTDEEIDRYNSAAVKVCKEKLVPVIDLNKFCRDWDSSFYSDYCHLTNEGYKCLGEEVANRLKRYLNAK